MYLDVQKADSGPLNFERRFPVGKLAWQDQEAIHVEEVRIEGQVVRATDGHLLRGRLEAVPRVNCARCLEDFELPLQVAVLRIYVRGTGPGAETEGEERRMQADEIPLTRYDGRRIDLRALAVEQVYLELPLKPICRDDCLGLCTRCGCNRNRGECGCVDDSIDPRLLALKNILNRS